MIAELVLGLDQGTGSTKAVVLDTMGTELYHFAAPVGLPTETGRQVLQDAAVLAGSIDSVLRQAFEWADRQQRRFRAIGLATQRSGVTAWNAETGVPSEQLITWADTTTIKALEKLGTTALKVSERTGLPTIPNFAAAKIAQLQAKYPWPGEKIATLDSYLLYCLSARQSFATDDTMASRTMLYDLKQGRWSEELCRIFSVDIRRLPRISATVDDFTLVEGVPLKVMIGDQQAALLGRTSGDRLPLLNLGTIASLTVATGEVPVMKPGLMSSVWFSRRTSQPKPGHDRAFSYIAELTSPVTGQLLRELVGDGKTAYDLHELSDVCEASWRTGRKIVAFSNLGRPFEPCWPQGVPDVLIATHENDAADIARAHVENVGNILVKMLDQFEEHELCFQGADKELMVAGGGSECEFLLQYVADCSGATVIVLPSREATARGAALATMIRENQARDVLQMNSLSEGRRIVPSDTTRRQKYLKWRRLEQDVLAGRVPPIAKVTERLA